MSSVRTEKRFRSSTQRRHTAVKLIEKTGKQLFDMGRCTPCQKANTFCFVLEGRSKCSSCTKKGVKQHCDGVFSEAEFEDLEQKKRELRRQVSEQHAEIGRKAAAVASACAALAQAQQEARRLEQEVDNYAEAQSRMLRQELEALDALEEANPSELPVAVLSGEEFVWDDSLVLAMMQDSGGMLPQTPG